jgi:nucleoside-diphosphate-sugar epimerase
MTESSTDSGFVALFGAAGAVGHSLAQQLDWKGTPYRTVGRNVETLQRDFPRSQTVRADFLTGEGTSEAANGVDTIFYTAGAPYTEFDKHPVMVRHALDAAQAAGVKRFVLISSVYSYGPARTLPVPESQPHQPNSRKGRFRWEQEQTTLERGSGAMRTMVVHLPDFYGPNAELGYANAFMREVLAGKTASFIGPSDAQREFIYIPDAADPLLRLAASDDAYGRCWNLGGQRVLARDFIAQTFAAAGMPSKYRAVPKFALQAFGLFVPLMREIAEMYYLSDSGFVLDDSALQTHLGGYAKTPVTEGIEQTIGWMREHPSG